MGQAEEHARNDLASSVSSLNPLPGLLSYDLSHGFSLGNSPGLPGALKGTGLPGLVVYSVFPLGACL